MLLRAAAPELRRDEPRAARVAAEHLGLYVDISLSLSLSIYIYIYVYVYI